MRSDLLPSIASASALALLFFLTVPSPRFPGGLSVAVYARHGELLGAAVSSVGQWRLPSSSVLPERFARALVAYEDKRFYYHAGVDPLALRPRPSPEREGRQDSLGRLHDQHAGGAHRPAGQRAQAGREGGRGPHGPPPRAAPRKDWNSRLLCGERALRRRRRRHRGGQLPLLRSGAGVPLLGRGRDSRRIAQLSLRSPPRQESGLAPVQARPPPPLSRPLGRDERGAWPSPSPSPSLPSPIPCPGSRPSSWLVSRRATRAAPPPRVDTTLDASLQERAAEILERRVGRLAAGGVHNGACIVARVDSGEVLAYVANVSPGFAMAHGDFDSGASAGSRGFAVAHGESVDLIRAERSSGSLFKPFLYAAALEAGELGPRASSPTFPRATAPTSPRTIWAAIRGRSAPTRPSRNRSTCPSSVSSSPSGSNDSGTSSCRPA